MKNEMTYSSGEKREAICIMREAAQWLIDTGRPLWSLEELTEERFSAPPGAFHVGWKDAKSAAAMILLFEDTLFWPDVPAGTSGFVHKLSVRREFAATGCAEAMLGHARDICADMGLAYLRLDCDASREKLCRLYERCGFLLAREKSLHTKKYGTIELALYQMRL